MRHRRERLIKMVEDFVHEDELSLSDAKSKEEIELVNLFHDWLDVRNEKTDKCTQLFDKMKPLFEHLLFNTNNPSHSKLSMIYSDKDMVSTEVFQSSAMELHNSPSFSSSSQN